jgi:hypothetical protein
MKKQIRSGQVPAAKLRNYFTELSSMLVSGESFHVRHSNDGTTSIRLARGQYLTISIQKGDQP